MISSALAEYDEDVAAEWARIRIDPEQWRCSPRGDESGGFWAVAVDGGRVLWFNDIEDGFNWSPYSARGTIGEYLCDQASFMVILERIAQAQSGLARAGLNERHVPADVIGPGTIERRQTTYWEVRAASEAVYRIHFREKMEVGFTSAAYASAEIVSIHPLLVQYDEPSRSLYFSGTPFNPRIVAENLDRVIREASADWRNLSDYAGGIDAVERRLRTGHGMLMGGPESVCGSVAQALEAAGVGASVLGIAAPRPGNRVLLLGRNYVVATAFVFEARDSVSRVVT